MWAVREKALKEVRGIATNVHMKPYGPLMFEHRIIEQIPKLIKKELVKVEKEGLIDPHFIDVTVGFLRNYADKCHHGKEEEILFRALESKQLSAGHKATLKRLLDDHVKARATVRSLIEAKEKYVNGDKRTLNAITKALEALAELYPAHITVEDKEFFIPVMGYFSREEQDEMVRQFLEFDRNIIHKEYKKIVDELRKMIGD